MKSSKILSLIISSAFLISCGSTYVSSSVSSEESSYSSFSSQSLTSSKESSTISETSESTSFSSSKSSDSVSSKASSSTAKEADAKHIPSNSKYALGNSEWTEFKFYDSYGPTWATDWNYYYNDTHNPISSGFYGGEDASKGNGAALEHKGQYLVSPMFESWEKIEANFEVWWCNHTSSKYKSTSGEPQMILKQYDENGYLTGTYNIELTKSQKPSNGYFKLNLDIYDNQMSFFELHFNNTVANGDGGYTFAIHSVSMKGWPYGKN